MISVCIVTRERHAQLASCLTALRDQEGCGEFEVLVVADRDPASVDVALSIFPNALTAVIAHASLGAARNVLFDQASGDILLFLDDDVVPAPTLLARLEELGREHPDVGVFGGPNLTPDGSGSFEQVQGAVLASFVAAGPVRHRYRLGPTHAASERDLTLCNLAVRRDQMVPFPPEVLGGEENAVLDELARQGVRMLSDPGLAVAHDRRKSWSGFWQQMLKYGRGRGQIIRRDRRTLHAPYIIPSLFLAYLLSLPVLATSSAYFLIPAGAYASAVVAAALGIAIRQSRSLAALAQGAGMIVALHVSYGIGVFVGVLEQPTHRRSVPSVSWITIAGAQGVGSELADENLATSTRPRTSSVA